MNVYIHRSIDLEGVCFSDTVYKTKEQAKEEVEKQNYIDSYVDLIIKVILDNEEIESNDLETFEQIKDFLESQESNYIFNYHVTSIIYKR